MKKVLGVSRLSKNMASVPTMSVPMSAVDCKAKGVPLGSLEVVYCFADPLRPFRTADIVSTVGAGVSRGRVASESWAGQAAAQMSAYMAGLASDHGHAKAIINFKSMVTLEDYVDKRTAKPNSHPSAASQPLSSPRGRQRSAGGFSESKVGSEE